LARYPPLPSAAARIPAQKFTERFVAQPARASLYPGAWRVESWRVTGTGMISNQFLIYTLFSIIWPCLFALVYAGLERLFPRLLVIDHEKE
jgi:hypothetical protein